MKQLVRVGALVLALLLLTGCRPLDPEGKPEQTQNGTTTHTPQQTPPSTQLPETPPEVPVTPTTPVPYVHRPPAEACIFKEPDADSEFVQIFGNEGAYTITEERYDAQNNLWGKLKSGLGWINLTDPFCGGADAPLVVAAYASKQVLAGEYHLAGLFTDDPYKVDVSILAHEAVTNVEIKENDMINEQVGKTLYSLDRLEPGKPIVAHLTFPGDFSSYVVTYTDASNASHQILLWMSMDDSNTIGWH